MTKAYPALSNFRRVAVSAALGSLGADLRTLRTSAGMPNAGELAAVEVMALSAREMFDLARRLRSNEDHKLAFLGLLEEAERGHAQRVGCLRAAMDRLNTVIAAR